jgi:hypothetical protein
MGTPQMVGRQLDPILAQGGGSGSNSGLVVALLEQL